MKRCSKCGEEKPLEEFHRNRSSKDGRQGYCKPCNIAQIKERAYYRDPILWHLRVAKSKAKHTGDTPPTYTASDVEEVLFLQQGVCVGCAGLRGPLGDNWHIDHCHATGRLRGILHPGCNLALGQTVDDPRVLRELADYLESGLYERIDDVLKRQTEAAA